MKVDVKENTKNLPRREGEKGDAIILQTRIVLRIPKQSLLSLIVILTHTYLHQLTPVHPVMTDVGRGRDLRGRSIDVEKEGIGDVKEGVRSVIRS